MKTSPVAKPDGQGAAQPDRPATAGLACRWRADRWPAVRWRGVPWRGAAWRGAAIWSAPVLVTAAAMAALGLWGLARGSDMGNDEVVSRWAALLSLRQLAHLVRHVDAVHGLYYLLLHGWMAVGTSPTAIRVPSVAAMIVAAALIVIVGRRLTGSAWAGLFAGLIMVVTPSISYYAQTARSYALVFACVLAETLALLRALEAESAEAPPARRARLRRRWLAYGALVTLGGYLNELSLLVLAAHAVTIALARCGRRTAVHWVVASGVAALLVSPLIAISVRQDGALSWVPRPGLRDVWVLYHDYFGATVWVPVLLVLCAAAALLPAPGTWRMRRTSARPTEPRTGARPTKPRGDARPSEPHGGGTGPETRGTGPEAGWWRGGVSLPSVAAPLLFVPAGLLMIESLIGPPLYVDRYVLYGEAGAALLAGAGVYRIGRWLGRSAHQLSRSAHPLDRSTHRQGQSTRPLGRSARGPRFVWVPGVVVCVAALVLQLAPQQRVRTPGSREFNFGGPAFYLAAHAHPGDGVLFFGPFYRKAELGYPVQFRRTRDIAEAVPPVVANPFRGIDKLFTAVRPLMLAERRLWVLGLRPSVSLAPGSMRQESLVLLRYFTRTAVRGYRGMWLTLWVNKMPG